ncbi:hypothetical protein C8R45DRAFT_942690 [Mycena sanguinolenta]|nr:hypothetical protein C8R45DRAFT_942690 [Mycena sanguinolenta]
MACWVKKGDQIIFGIVGLDLARNTERISAQLETYAPQFKSRNLNKTAAEFTVNTMIGSGASNQIMAGFISLAALHGNDLSFPGKPKCNMSLQAESHNTPQTVSIPFEANNGLKGLPAALDSWKFKTILRRRKHFEWVHPKCLKILWPGNLN